MQTTLPNYAKILPNLRQEGDLIVDDILKFLVEKNKINDFNAFINQLQTNQDVIHLKNQLEEKGFLAEMPIHLVIFFENFTKIPVFISEKKIQNGHQFFEKYMPALLSMLGYLSLPYCYAGADGAMVLHFSERLGYDTQKRLLETAQFVTDVMQENAFFDASKKGFVSVLKVRFMHAWIRLKLLKSNYWNIDWGFPINQEDMAGTNLAFSWICVRGLRTLGYDILTNDLEDFLHLWAMIGYFLGVKEEILPQNAKSAYWLDNAIAVRQFRPAPHTLSLTKTLLETLANQSKQIPAVLVPSLVRYLVGENVADILGVEKSIFVNMPFGFIFQNQKINTENLQKTLKELFEKEKVEIKLGEKVSGIREQVSGISD